MTARPLAAVAGPDFFAESQSLKKNSLATLPIRLDGRDFLPGDRGSVDLRIGTSIDYQPVTMSVQVIRGKKPGPCLLLSAALHGDEINGVEIIRRLL
ncbi:MAG: succinylglutamate desuccinylase/aspartoacylase family protein, partial [Verrucomicrobiae bacterium]|nr:succinylglutamate desuccinylase/aspartoacylase family protein [Verrucomicrobiae bacterium]